MFDVKGAKEFRRGVGVGNMHGRAGRMSPGDSVERVLRADLETPGAEAGNAFQA